MLGNKDRWWCGKHCCEGGRQGSGKAAKRKIKRSLKQREKREWQVEEE